MRDFSLVQRLDLITEVCKGKKVLHLGCTDYPYTEDAIADERLLHFKLATIAGELYGIDADQKGIDILKSHDATNIFRGDLERLEELELNETFDVILAGEMIEHLNNPGLFLDCVKRFMRSDSRLVLTTINAYCGMRFLYYGLRGRRGKAEPVHPDHVAYYSYSTLSLMLKRHGLQIDNFLFYDVGKEHRIHNRWYINLANDICVSIAPQWADGVIAICKLQS